MNETEIAQRFAGRWHRGYAKGKLRSDPLYDGVFSELQGSTLPLFDIGCGIGILAFYLRSRGLDFPILATDYDAKKIDAANAAIADLENIDFRHSDARTGLPEHSGNVTILDILQFFTAEQQTELLAAAARRVAPGGVLIIRTGLKGKGWRFKITYLGDLLARATFWMKAAPTHYPTRESLTDCLAELGFSASITPLWGKTPFNNHLAVFPLDDRDPRI
jgi:2-polyprenyl-3-methyl-5-hydroxy-6-metoxy-1,4-benzoquinol methylase